MCVCVRVCVCARLHKHSYEPTGLAPPSLSPLGWRDESVVSDIGNVLFFKFFLFIFDFLIFLILIFDF